MSQSKASVLVRGSINIDEFYHLEDIVRPGQTVAARSLTKRLGGKGANQAKAVACAGVNVLLDGAVGDDGEGQGVREKLCEPIASSEGRILEDRIRLAPGVSTGKAVIQLANDGENCIIILGGANTHPLENFDPLIPKGTTHLLLANEIVLDSTISYLTTAASQSITTIFNPSPMPSSSELRSFPFHQLDWLIVNEGELASIFKSLVGEPLPASNNPEESIKNSMKLFSKLSSRTGIICTLGPQGVLFVRPSPGSEGGVQTGHLPAAKLENALKDTTGAGDCFMGFFAAGLAKSEQKAGSKEKDISDEAFEEILKTCLTACSMCVESEGAQDSYRPISQVVERMKRTFA